VQTLKQQLQQHSDVEMVWVAVSDTSIKTLVFFWDNEPAAISVSMHSKCVSMHSKCV
jgi:hypothetical protein